MSRLAEMRLSAAVPALPPGEEPLCAPRAETIMPPCGPQNQNPNGVIFKNGNLPGKMLVETSSQPHWLGVHQPNV